MPLTSEGSYHVGTIITISVLWPKNVRYRSVKSTAHGHLGGKMVEVELKPEKTNIRAHTPAPAQCYTAAP